MLEVFYWGVSAYKDESIYREFGVENVMISYLNIERIKNCDFAKRIFVDSGGFQFFTRFNEYPYDINKYLFDISIYLNHVRHFASMDYPCKPEIVKKRDSSVDEHVQKTVELAVRMHEKMRTHPHLRSRFVPVIQGWRLDDYLHCCELYENIGMTAEYDYFALGSLCRRHREKEICRIVRAVKRKLGKDIRLHAFGTKISVLQHKSFLSSVYSADTSAWSFEAMYTETEKGNMPYEIRILPNNLRYRVVFYIYKHKVDKLLQNNHVSLEMFNKEVP